MMRPKSESRCSRGFVLVNALVLVAALAAAAVLLLARAEGSRARQAAGQGDLQLGLYLDSFEALAITLLGADRGVVDHLGEAWARAEYAVPLDRGAVAGHLDDLQGRFNINWLANPEDAFAADGFVRLTQGLGLSPQQAERIAAFVRPGRPGPAAGYAGQTPPIRPVGGPVLMVAQLQVIPGLRAEDLARLRPYLAALPSDSTLNINTAPPQLLQALFAELGPAAADTLVRARDREPFASVEAFVLLLQAAAGPEVVAQIDPEARLSVGSVWFAAEITAALDGQTRARDAVFERRPLPKSVRVAYRRDSVLGPE